MKRTIEMSILLLVTALVAAMWGCGGQSRSNTNNNKNDEVVVPVEIAAIYIGDISAYFTGTAIIEAEEETEVVAKVGGVVERLLEEEGDYVEAGQVLAKLDDEKIAVQLEQARANLKKLESNYERNKDLHEKNLISTEVFQQVRYEYEHQKAVYDLAELDLDYTSIRTPIRGIVAERLVKVGNMILPNQATFRVTGLNPLIAVLHVPERQLARLRVGQRTLLRVDALGNQEFPGTIKRVSPVVDPETGTVKITVEVKDGSKQLRPGMFARLKIIYDIHTDIVLAPKDAIMAEDRESAVFVVRDSVAYRQFIEVGYANSTHIEVLSGLQPGDTVVTTGKGSLKDSTRVEIVTD
jgi:membrane fusion protein (multidrug efflux system)